MSNHDYEFIGQIAICVVCFLLLFMLVFSFWGVIILGGDVDRIDLLIECMDKE